MIAKSFKGKSNNEMLVDVNQCTYITISPLVNYTRLHELGNLLMAGFFTCRDYGKALDINQWFYTADCSRVVMKEDCTNKLIKSK